jgi:hypothetical protein
MERRQHLPEENTCGVIEKPATVDFARPKQ